MEVEDAYLYLVGEGGLRNEHTEESKSVPKTGLNRPKAMNTYTTSALKYFLERSNGAKLDWRVRSKKLVHRPGERMPHSKTTTKGQMFRRIEIGMPHETNCEY